MLVSGCNCRFTAIDGRSLKESRAHGRQAAQRSSFFKLLGKPGARGSRNSTLFSLVGRRNKLVYLVMFLEVAEQFSKGVENGFDSLFLVRLTVVTFPTGYMCGFVQISSGDFVANSQPLKNITSVLAPARGVPRPPTLG